MTVANLPNKLEVMQGNSLEQSMKLDDTTMSYKIVLPNVSGDSQTVNDSYRNKRSVSVEKLLTKNCVYENFRLRAAQKNALCKELEGLHQLEDQSS